jgi:tetratricopeptide (TPR) repeat protein
VLPTYGAAAFGLAALEEQRGRLGHAITVMIELLTRDPYRLDALQRLGDLLVQSDRLREARFAYERVLRFAPATSMPGRRSTGWNRVEADPWPLRGPSPS